MELDEVIRGAGTCRYFTDDPVGDEELRPLFDAARFGPQGGNRQPVRWIVVRDPAVKRQLKDWYLQPWKAYYEGVLSGNVKVLAKRQVVEDANHFAVHFDRVPVIVVVCASLPDLTATDKDLDRVGIVGGGSVYPSVQNLLLKARDVGLGAALTTLLVSFEPKLKELFELPEDVAIAGTISIGYPERNLPRRLTRQPLEELVYNERFGEPLFAGADA